MLTIRMFGPFQLLRDGAPLAGMSLRAAQLLAFLLLKPDRELAKSWVAEHIWQSLDLMLGDGQEEEERHKRQASFRQALSDLNRALDSVPEIGIESGYGTIRLCLKQGESDLGAFDAEIAAGKRGNLNAYEAACARCERGVRYRLLEGWEEHWIEGEREWRSREYLRALEALAEHSREQQPRKAAYYGERAVAEAPEQIASWANLMQDYLDSNEPVAAMNIYKRFCTRYDKMLLSGQAQPDRRMQEMMKRAMQMLKAMGAVSVNPEPLEPAGGGLALNSRVYLERAEDLLFHNAMARRDGLILIKGPRQVGKTSLLTRGRAHAQLMGARIAWTDFQAFDEATLATPDALYHALARSLEEELEPRIPLTHTWNPDYPPHENLARFLLRSLLSEQEAPLVWILDEVDRLFGCPFKNDVFGWFRALFNKRQSSAPTAPIRRLILIFAYATEARLLITDPNMSPFNVGTPLTLADFTPEQVAELNVRYQEPLRDQEEIRNYVALVGGHPYLACRGLFEMASRSQRFDTLQTQADSSSGIFADHLQRLYALLIQNPALLAAMKEIGSGRPCPNAEIFLRLQSGGLLSGDPEQPRFRCGLYRRFVEKRLC